MKREGKGRRSVQDVVDDLTGDGKAKDAGTLEVVCLADVVAERVRWLWPGRIALGKLTLLDADPGTGKSTLMVDLAARVTLDDVMPDGSRGDLDGPRDVVFLTAEDGVADTVRPRFDAAGGDPQRVSLLPAIHYDDGTDRLPELPTDVGPIREVIENKAAALVVVDVLMAYLADNVETRSDHKVRRVLGQLARLAAETGAAVVALRHLNKSGGTNALYRGGGSIGFTGQARTVLLAAPADGDGSTDGGERVLAVVKCNVAKLAPSLTYTLAECENGAARVVWGGETDTSANDLLGTPDAEEAAAGSTAEDIITELLRRGAVLAKEAQDTLRNKDVAEKTWKRAKGRLGVESDRVGGTDGAWWWHWPGQPYPRPAPAANEAKGANQYTTDDPLRNPAPAIGKNGRSKAQRGSKRVTSGNDTLWPADGAPEDPPDPSPNGAGDGLEPGLWSDEWEPVGGPAGDP
jgi:hypothetical protein